MFVDGAAIKIYFIGVACDPGFAASGATFGEGLPKRPWSRLVPFVMAGRRNLVGVLF